MLLFCNVLRRVCEAPRVGKAGGEPPVSILYRIDMSLSESKTYVSRIETERGSPRFLIKIEFGGYNVNTGKVFLLYACS